MNLDLDPYLETLAPWDFTVRLGGKLFTTRPPTVGELLVLEEMSVGEAKLAKLKGFVEGLFPAGKPDVAGWSERALRKFVTAFIEYWKDNVKKNLEAEKRAATPAVPPT